MDDSAHICRLEENFLVVQFSYFSPIYMTPYMLQRWTTWYENVVHRDVEARDRSSPPSIDHLHLLGVPWCWAVAQPLR